MATINQQDYHLNLVDYKSLFIQYAKENIEAASAQHNKNKEFAYKKVLSSLLKYPLPIYYTKDVYCLDGVGEKIISRFESMLRRDHVAIICDDPMLSQSKTDKENVIPSNNTKIHPQSTGNTLGVLNKLAKRGMLRPNSKYIPKRGSLPHLVLVELYAPSRQSLTLQFQELLNLLRLNGTPAKLERAVQLLQRHVLVNYNLLEVAPLISLTERGLTLVEAMQALENEQDPNANGSYTTTTSHREFYYVNGSGDIVDERKSAIFSYFDASFYVLVLVHVSTCNKYTNCVNLEDKIADSLKTRLESDHYKLMYVNEDDLPLISPSTVVVSQQSVEYGLVQLSPADYDIILVLDTRETQNMADRANLQTEMYNRQFQFVQKQLPLGDFIWVARVNNSDRITVSPDDPLFISLGVIGERKRVDDLSASISDGRFNDQRTRLGLCNIHYKYLIIEDIDNSTNSNTNSGTSSQRTLGNAMGSNTMKGQMVNADGMHFATTNAQIQNSISIQRTKSIADTVELFINYRCYLKDYLKDKQLVAYIPYINTTLSINGVNALLCSYKSLATGSEFSTNSTDTFERCVKGELLTDFMNATSAQTQTNLSQLENILAAQLSCVPGISYPKAVQLASHFGTLKNFISANTPTIAPYLLDLLGKSQALKTHAFFNK